MLYLMYFKFNAFPVFISTCYYYKQSPVYRWLVGISWGQISKTYLTIITYFVYLNQWMCAGCSGIGVWTGRALVFNAVTPEKMHWGCKIVWRKIIKSCKKTASGMVRDFWPCLMRPLDGCGGNPLSGWGLVVLLRLHCFYYQFHYGFDFQGHIISGLKIT